MYTISAEYIITDVYKDPNGGYNPQTHSPKLANFWHLGAIQEGTYVDTDQITKPLLLDVYVMSLGDFIREEIRTDPTDLEIAREFNRDWKPPQPLGTITITNATGIRGILTFTSTSGHSGTFDMATETWYIK